jgi:hypothetical protein
MEFGLIAGLRRNARERINAIFLSPVLLISPIPKVEPRFYLNAGKRVNIIFEFFLQGFRRGCHPIMKHPPPLGYSESVREQAAWQANVE